MAESTTVEEPDSSLENTPTYAVATAVALFILVSLLIERGIHRLKKYLRKKNQRPLRKVVDKMQEELMLLGFISLLLTVFQSTVSNICVNEDFSRHMLPCALNPQLYEADAPTAEIPPAASHVQTGEWKGRKLLYHLVSENHGQMRQLMSSGGESSSKCGKGKVSFISLESLHQLHIFIFVLAIMHVVYSLVTVSLGFARVNNWRKWERETRCENYDGRKDLEKRFCQKCQQNDKSFVERYAGHPCSESRICIWVLCFFRQFAGSVSREDYLTFRLGFLHNHNLGDSFNFRDYVMRSMEVDYKSVIGVSWWLWVIVVIFLLINVHGWYTYFWAAFIPTVITCAIGTKQQHIISTLALQGKRHALSVLESEKSLKLDPARISPRASDIAAAIKPSDKLFWFDNPRWLLRLLHFVIFQNAFELAVFFWQLATFGWKSCYLSNHKLLIVRIIVGVVTQLLASYSTLPVYALVTQMGSTMKETVFTKDVYEGLIGWKIRAARKGRGRSSGEVSESAATSKEGSGQGPLSQGEAGSGPPEDPLKANTELQLFSSTSAGASAESQPNANSHQEGDKMPADDFTKHCQRMYGKALALQKISKSRISQG